MPSREQSWSSESYRRDAGFVSELGAEVLGWLAPRPGERILDLGCGDGALTARLAEAGSEVVGIDMSADFLAAARARGLDARRINGEELEFDAEFDAVFSNAAMHWMLDQDRVIAGVAAALKPGGRFVGEFGGHGNVAAIVTALTSVARRYGLDEHLAHPWVFPTPGEHEARLRAGGFTVRRIALIPRPTPLKTGMRAWLEIFRKPMFEQLPPSKRGAVLDEVCDLLRPGLCDDAGNWTADYVRLRFEAVRG